MMFFNEFEIDDAIACANREQHEVAGQAALILRNLKEWTNSHSDGWPYWSAPSRAAAQLQEQLYLRYHAAYDRRIESDMSPSQLAGVLRPIKSMLTKHGADWREVLGIQ